jgi:hypothetical protein
MRIAFTLAAFVLGLAFINASSALAADEKASDVAVGYIHSVDLKAGTFVLGGKNESQTTFRVGVKTDKGRADCLLLLDGKMAKPEAAMKAGLKATVTYVKVGDDLGASKIEVTSAAK